MNTPDTETLDAVARHNEQMANKHLLTPCETNYMTAKPITQAEAALEVLQQAQPGMPALPVAWREWMVRQLKICARADNKEVDLLRASLENLRHDVRAAVYLLRDSKPDQAVRMLEGSLL